MNDYSGVTKKGLREYYRKAADISDEEMHMLSLHLSEKILNLIKNTGAACVLLYNPMRGEPDISPLFPVLRKLGITVLLPKCISKSVFYATEYSECLIADAAGIPAPCGDEYEGKIDIAVIPGMAFDREGYRLGRGGGAYDRFLENRKLLKVGIAFSWQICDRLPIEEHDVKLDCIFTDKGRIK